MRYSAVAIAPEAYELYIRGRKASYEGRHAEAITFFRQAAAIEPEDAAPRIAIADELIADGQDDEAAAEAKSIRERWPDEPEAWILSGKVAARGGDGKAASEAYDHAIALRPDDETAYLEGGAVREALSQDERAIDIYERLLLRWPESVEGHYRLGQVYARGKRLKEAEEQLVRATELDGDHIDARVALADVYRKTGRGKLATQTLRDAFDRSGEDPSVGEQLFKVLLDAGDRQAALDLLGVLDADWRDADSRLLFGYLYLQIHHAAEAEKIAKAVLARDDKNHAARILEARALAQSHKRADAIAVLLEIPSTAASEYADARALAGDLYARDGKVKEARKVVEEALAVNADNVGLIVEEAQLVEKDGDLAGARKLLDDAQAKRADDQDLIYARAQLEDRNGGSDKAVAIMQVLLDSDPDSVMALNFIGYSLASRGVELTRAEKLLAHAVELKPDDGYVLDSYGWLEVQEKELDKAAATLERADRLAPDEPEILYHLGEAYARRGDTTKAKEIFTRALGLDPDDKIRLRLEERVKTATK
jgi:tetratricopeptide (TPR) repeat protein